MPRFSRGKTPIFLKILQKKIPYSPQRLKKMFSPGILWISSARRIKLLLTKAFWSKIHVPRFWVNLVPKAPLSGGLPSATTRDKVCRVPWIFRFPENFQKMSRFWLQFPIIISPFRLTDIRRLWRNSTRSICSLTSEKNRFSAPGIWIYSMKTPISAVSSGEAWGCSLKLFLERKTKLSLMFQLV